MLVFYGCLLSSFKVVLYTVTRILVLKQFTGTKLYGLPGKTDSGKNVETTTLCQIGLALSVCVVAVHGRFAGLHQHAIQVGYHSMLFARVSDSSSFFRLPNYTLRLSFT